MSRRTHHLTGAIALSFLWAAGAQAQLLSNPAPAEYPPAGYAANQYVDSLGCAFIRAGIGGATTWVPRVGRDRRQLCGFQPTGGAVAAQAPQAVPVVAAPVQSAPIQSGPAGPAPVQPTPVRLTPVASPLRTNTDVGDPIPTVAGITTAPVLRSPAVVPMAASVPVSAPVASPAARPRMTRAEACDGRFGVQPTFISARTGQPIDCGAAPVSVAVRTDDAAASVLPASYANAPRMTRAEACIGRSGPQPTFLSARTGLPIDCGDGGYVIVASEIATPRVVSQYAAPGVYATTASPVGVANDPYPGIRRATLAEVCQEAAVTGDRYRNVVTGLLVQCDTVTMLANAGPVAPSGPALIGGPAVPGQVATYTVSRTQVLRAVEPVPTRSRTMIEELISPSPVPASNPVQQQTQHIRPPAGYEQVWDDGRINLQRGVAQPVSGQVLAVREMSRTPVAAVPQAVVSSRYFVQVGSFGDTANAEATAARLRGMGLPVGFGNATRNGQNLRVVAAGPFDTVAQLNAALQAVHAAGYSDAFARR